LLHPGVLAFGTKKITNPVSLAKSFKFTVSPSWSVKVTAVISFPVTHLAAVPLEFPSAAASSFSAFFGAAFVFFAGAALCTPLAASLPDDLDSCSGLVIFLNCLTKQSPIQFQGLTKILNEMQDYSQGHQRKHQNEDVNSLEFLAHKKHFMILSSAGKPVYSRYGNEAKLSSLLALVQAFLSVFIESGDLLQSITTGEYRFCFKVQGPLYYVAISKTNESTDILQTQLEMLHNTILFTLTNTQLVLIFEKHLNYDLRVLLGGTDVLLDSIAKSFRDPWIFLNSSSSLKLPSKVRLDLDKAWLNSAQPKSCIFGMFIAHQKLVSIFHGKNNTLHSKDIQLLINLVYSSSTFR
jgi:First Longin domain of FUZ, MON1 and HPS1/Second Longin domain of FUZ, MON1 and HPS1